MGRLHSLTNLINNPTPLHLAVLVAIAIVAIAGVFIVSRISPTAIIAVGAGAEIFSGNWKEAHISLPLDRALLLLGLLSMILGGRRLLAERRLVLQPIHLLLLAVATVGTASAIWAGTIATHNGFYALTDRLGLVPFLSFVLAPLLFGTPKKREVLLIVVVVVGGYLGFTALMEETGLHQLVFPSFIDNPNVGTQVDRARGPFLDAAGNGLGLMFGGAAGVIGLVTWKRLWVRVLCAAVIVLCGLGVLFTLTRAVWIGAALGTSVALVVAPRTRRYALPALGGTAVVIIIAISVVPGLHAKVTARADAQSSVWDRLNTDRAALSAVEQHPLFGLGWQTFETKGPSYLRQSLGYPLTGAGLEVHNVFLSHAVELGLPGSILWTLAFVCGIGGPILRRGPPELDVWRVALLAIAICFVVVANLGPLSYAFPNLMIWMLAGTIGFEHLSRPLGVCGEGEDHLEVVPTPEMTVELTPSVG
jgi:putative inorganic carbon (HCO3(-)) transporter